MLRAMSVSPSRKRKRPHKTPTYEPTRPLELWSYVLDYAIIMIYIGPRCRKLEQKVQQKTYKTGGSLVVTHPTTKVLPMAAVVAKIE
jgi:hypothetical protein